MSIIAILPCRSVISISGKEAGTFLNGLISADIAQVDASEPAYGALLTPQGKILFDFFIQKQADIYLLDCSSAQKMDLIRHLNFYKLRAKIEIADKSEALKVAAGWDGAELPGLAYTDPRTAAAGRRTMACVNDLAAIGDAGEEAYARHRIFLGLADTDCDIGSGELFPHEANFDQLNGFSTDKGCYIGQEVVSRMRHKAKVRKRIVIANGDRADLTAGENIVADKKLLGRVLSAQGRRGIALIRLDRLETAYANGDEIRSGAVSLSFEKPPWGTFELPEKSS